MKTASSLKYKSLTIFTSLSTIKFDCNPKYTIPYVKVCDNVYLTKCVLTLALFFIKAHTLLPHSSMSSILRWTEPPSAVLQECPSHSTVHNNAVVTLQSYTLASFFPFKSSLSFKLG